MSADFQTYELNATPQSESALHYDAAGQAQVMITQDVDLRDAEFTRDGADLVLRFENGETIKVDGYFSALESPTLVGTNGAQLPSGLVDSFLKSGPSYEVAQNYTLSDVSPVGSVQEFSGRATVTHPDGSVEVVQIGTAIYPGDIIETDAEGAVNIVFNDETSFAVSNDARLAIDEYVYDPAAQGEGTQNFSVLKGMFVFTSGLIGREDPDDVEIATPSGSIGIRGTIIAGDVDSGEITVVEGAIVLRGFDGEEITLAEQFDTAKFTGENGGVEHMGVLEAANVADKFASISDVAPTLFSSIEDSIKDGAAESVEDAAEEAAIDGAEEIQAEDELNEAEDAQGEDKPAQSPEDAHKEAAKAQEEVIETVEESAQDDVQPVEAVEEVVELAEPMEMDKAAVKENIQALKDVATDADADVGARMKAAKALKAIKQAREEASAEDAVQEAKDATMGSDDLDTTMIDPSLLNQEPQDQGPPVFHVGPADNSSEITTAHQSHAIYVGNSDDNTFTNNGYQNLSFRGGDGNDTIDLFVDDSGAANFWSMHGGEGAEDTLHINGLTDVGVGQFKGELDFSNVGNLKGIEVIDLSLNSSKETITLTAQDVLDNGSHDVSTLSGIVSVNGRDIDFTNVEVLKIEGDSGDKLNLELNSDWEFVDNSEISSASGLGLSAHEGYFNEAENVTLIVSQSMIDNVTGL